MPDTDPAELAKRLRGVADLYWFGSDWQPAACRKAADLLEAQAAEIERRRGDWCELMSQLTRFSFEIGIQPIKEEDWLTLKVPDELDWFAEIRQVFVAQAARIAELERERDEALLLCEGPSTLRELANEAGRSRMREAELEKLAG